MVGVFTVLLFIFVSCSLAKTDEEPRVPASRRGSKGVIEGYVRDDSGKPIKGAFITIERGSYATQGGTEVIPIIVPHAVGAIAIDDPTTVHIHAIGWHLTRTNKYGFFRVKNLPEGAYHFLAQICSFRTRSACGVAKRDRQKADKYNVPNAILLAVNGGQTLKHDVVFAAAK
jgi:hypothetical protein